MENFFLRTFFGFIIIGLSNLILPNAIGIVFCSIILSCGLALAIWVPLAYALGWIATFWWLPLNEDNSALKPTQIQTHKTIDFFNPYQTSIHTYIVNCRAKGFSREEIERQLLATGWTAEDIAQQFSAAEESRY